MIKRAYQLFLLLLLLCLAVVARPETFETNSSLYAAAKREGKVVIYSSTSRIFRIEKLFEQRYPGIDLIAFVLSSREQIMRLKAENRAGIGIVDVVYLSDAAASLALAKSGQTLQQFVPSRLQQSIPLKFRQPILSHRLSSKVLLYNEEAYSQPPVDNLWELTLPKWRGRVLMVDPSSRTDYLDLLVAFIIQSPAMEQAYTAYFGKVPVLKEGVTTVGEKFIRDLFSNDLVLVANTERLNAAIGKRGQHSPAVGFGTYSDIRNNQTRNWALQIANDVQPATGIVYPVILAPASSAPHPAAARLLIDFMMGDNSANGGSALAPFLQPGEYVTRTDIVYPPQTLALGALNAWTVDPAALLVLRQQIFDLVLTLESQ